ncbi:NAD(P)-binding domain-containing protein [Syntrophobacter fumaroxidans]|uniref:FAD-dependent pyridine nucleotide-disulphide oxidoreductase n=1 Tax=Syntrophobacter fumaroxidans (strain DSM 10017 / MPOB) TaxID=335543 RepID=A0LKY8_SYNFM|nr:NAD(P)-binding domain-containing protein [Syntrophobacter fumaroxidans]ABK18090.1 FAD-dependent pyridine nucleotide-disulphide oxidoreductase [Syntrophobacter fumaroxidans MPOB]
MDRVDVVIVGAGPGGLAAAIRAGELGLSFVVLEKGSRVLQGILDTYPRGKKVYPTVPKGEEQPFGITELQPANEPVEDYFARVETCVKERGLQIQYGHEFQGFVREKGGFAVDAGKTRYSASAVILAFGSNIPIDLGVYGEAKMVARNLGNPEEHIGAPTLVLGGGNAAADVVSTLSKTKRDVGDSTPVYWGHRREHFKVDKDVARDLGEEILLGGNIKILQGTVPRIGEVDEEGVERLIIQTQSITLPHGVEMQQGMSFPMKHVIACIGTQGPSIIFDRLGLQQITCTEGVCKIGREGAKLVMLNSCFQTSVKGVYAIGGAISPAYLLVEEEGALREKKHSNLIFKAVQDGVHAAEDIAGRLSRA